MWSVEAGAVGYRGPCIYLYAATHGPLKDPGALVLSLLCLFYLRYLPPCFNRAPCTPLMPLNTARDKLI